MINHPQQKMPTTVLLLVLLTTSTITIFLISYYYYYYYYYLLVVVLFSFSFSVFFLVPLFDDHQPEPAMTSPAMTFHDHSGNFVKLVNYY